MFNYRIKNTLLKLKLIVRIKKEIKKFKIRNSLKTSFLSFFSLPNSLLECIMEANLKIAELIPNLEKNPIPIKIEYTYINLPNSSTPNALANAKLKNKVPNAETALEINVLKRLKNIFLLFKKLRFTFLKKDFVISA